MASADAAPALETGLGALTLVLVGLVYVAPALLGAHRDVDVLPRLVRLNILTGWTGAGWVYCLYLAARGAPRAPHREQGVVRHERAWLLAAGGRTAPFLGPEQR